MEDRTVCEKCYNKNRRKSNNNNTLIQNQQTKIDKNNNKDDNSSVSAYENHRHVFVGPTSVGKAFYKLTIFEEIGIKKLSRVLTRASNQYPNYQTSNEIKPIDKY